MLTKLLKLIINASMRSKRIGPGLLPIITHHYQSHVRNSFVVSKSVFKVKKGKRRYMLFFLEDRFGKKRFKLARHWESKQPEVRSYD